MKFYFIITLIITLGLISCSEESMNSNYSANSFPLKPNAFIHLPVGSITPAGWLKDQLTAQANGLTGNLNDFWPDLINSAWKGGDGEAWERGPYYLDGLVPLAYQLKDEKLLKIVHEWMEPILGSGRPNGWFGPEKNTDRWPLAVASKVLMQYYEASGDKRALDILEGYFRYLHDNSPDWPDDSWRGVRAIEHAVTGYALYRITKDTTILNTIKSIFDNSFDWTGYYEKFPWDSAAFADKKIPLNWKADGLTAHVVNNAMAVKYPGLWYQQSGDEHYRKAVFEALQKYDKNHGQIGGRFSGDEHLAGKSPGQGTELCAVVEFMFSLQNLLEVIGDPAFGDRLEMLAFNALPGAMTADCWAHQYDQQANQVLVTKDKRNWTTNGDASNIYGLMPNYPCCLANFHQGWPKYVQSMWMATNDNGLAAIVYGPCSVKAKADNGIDVMIEEITDYPFAGNIRMVIHTDGEVEFPLVFRIPGWAENASINYPEGNLNPKKESFIKINRLWKEGDEVNISFPMGIKSEQGYNNSEKIRRGPLYFALRIGKLYDKIELKERNFGSIEYKGSVDWEIRPSTEWNVGILPLEDQDFEIIQTKISKYPFSDIGEMIYDNEKSEYIEWNLEAPLLLKVKGRIISEWGIKDNSAADPPESPVFSKEPIQRFSLIPYGCARLRISEFPVLKN